MYWKDLRLCACACGFVVLPCFAVAQNAGVKPAPLDVDLGAVTAQEQIVSPMPGSAAYEAPSVAPMDATQPTAVISQQSIENNFSQTSSYSDIVKLSPSVSGTDPDGPGLMESQVLSIRGFQDGQYNVTFDGIPLVETAPGGDPNDFAHHTTSYFMDNDVGSIDVDRGPGTAATIGAFAYDRITCDHTRSHGPRAIYGFGRSRSRPQPAAALVS
jgi:iron complex outermembrane receptor protein